MFSLLLLVLSVRPAGAQEAEMSLEARLLGGQLDSIDTLGVRYFNQRVTEARTDSAEVYYNVRGEPVAWRAWLDGRYYVYWQPYGRFQVSDSTLAALDVYRKDRQLLEMLEALERVEQAAKKTR